MSDVPARWIPSMELRTVPPDVQLRDAVRAATGAQVVLTGSVPPARVADVIAATLRAA